jgi:hypothetical protein
MPHKMVNGVRVELTDAEIAEMAANEAESEANRLPEWRSKATLSRREFCIAAYRAGLLSEADAVLAAKGEWPASFDAALVGLPTNVVTEAKIEWASVSEIRRSAPLLATVQATAGVTDEQLDALFGWTT